jgi:protein-tyrosine-phosphatase
MIASMCTERKVAIAEGVSRRVQLHAALADPVRLRIVDTLSLGDASPSALQHELGIGSNLLAHHLGVLDRAGVVVRHRSEADRRRVYLRLDHASLEDLLPGSQRAPLTAPRIVFVCTANSARSQLAAALWNHAHTVPATSAGTHPADSVAKGAAQVAARRGTPITQPRPQAFADVVGEEDLLVTVCDHAHEELNRALRLGGHGSRTLHWSVLDPVPVNTRAAYDTTYDDLAVRVAHLAPNLAAHFARN